MTKLDKVLLVADLAPGWDAAVETAITLATLSNSEIVPVHVVPQPLDGALDMRELQLAIDARLRAMIRRAGFEGSEFDDTIITIGTRYQRIMELADELAVDAIAIAAGNGVGSKGPSMGPTAARVVRLARRPVWVVRPGAPPVPSKILCPVDMSNSSERALRTAVSLARTFEAELTVLHVALPIASLQRAEAEIGGRPAPEWTQEFERRGRFQALIDRYDFQDTDWWSSVRSGDPVEQIISAVSENRHDLIVMGTVGRTRLSLQRVGGVVTGVLDRLPCSLFAVRDTNAAYDHLGRQISSGLRMVQTGRTLLAEGHASEAVGSFESAIDDDLFCGPAWEGLADAQAALGLAVESARNRGLARLIADRS